MQPIRKELEPDVDAISEVILHIFTESRRLAKDYAARFGLTGSQLAIVKLLDQIGDLSLSELSARIRARTSTVTGIIDRMEREALVLRVRSTRDRRVVHIRLRPKGRKLARQIPAGPRELFREVIAGLVPGDARDLLRILTKIATKMQQRNEDRERGEG